MNKKKVEFQHVETVLALLKKPKNFLKIMKKQCKFLSSFCFGSNFK